MNYETSGSLTDAMNYLHTQGGRCTKPLLPYGAEPNQLW